MFGKTEKNKSKRTCINSDISVHCRPGEFTTMASQNDLLRVRRVKGVRGGGVRRRINRRERKRKGGEIREVEKTNKAKTSRYRDRNRGRGGGGEQKKRKEYKKKTKRTESHKERTEGREKQNKSRGGVTWHRPCPAAGHVRRLSRDNGARTRVYFPTPTALSRSSFCFSSS